VKVVFTPSARAELLSARNYIRRDNPQAAVHFRERAEAVSRRLEEFPTSGSRTGIPRATVPGGGHLSIPVLLSSQRRDGVDRCGMARCTASRGTDVLNAQPLNADSKKRRSFLALLPAAGYGQRWSA